MISWGDGQAIRPRSIYSDLAQNHNKHRSPANSTSSLMRVENQALNIENVYWSRRENDTAEGGKKMK